MPSTAESCPYGLFRVTLTKEAVAFVLAPDFNHARTRANRSIDEIVRGTMWDVDIEPVRDAVDVGGADAHLEPLLPSGLQDRMGQGPLPTTVGEWLEYLAAHPPLPSHRQMEAAGQVPLDLPAGGETA